MKLLILHLSDIHFEKNGDVSGKNTEGIIRALKTIDTFSYVIVVISGDIAYSGKVSQYNTAYKFFF